MQMRGREASTSRTVVVNGLNAATPTLAQRSYVRVALHDRNDTATATMHTAIVHATRHAQHNT